MVIIKIIFVIFVRNIYKLKLRNMKNEIKNTIIKHINENGNDVLCITSKERKVDLNDSNIFDEKCGYLFIKENEKESLTILKLEELIKTYCFGPVFVKNIFIEDISILLSDIEIDDIFYKYKYIAEQLLNISIENNINIILFDNNRKIAFYEYSDFCFSMSYNNIERIKNRDGNDYVNGSDYIEYISKNLSNFNYIVFK